MQVHAKRKEGPKGPKIFFTNYIWSRSTVRTFYNDKIIGNNESVRRMPGFLRTFSFGYSSRSLRSLAALREPAFVFRNRL